jgi:hypothetical protein
MDTQYTTLFEFVDMFEDIETKAGPGLLSDFKETLHEATAARYTEHDDSSLSPLYTNDPSIVLGPDKSGTLPEGCFYFILMEGKWEGGELKSANNVVFIVIDFPNGEIIDKSDCIIKQIDIN